MGPLIPNELIPIEWNFVISTLIGFAFGYILEASGFSSSRKLVGVFYGYDFAVLKVFFTAAAVAVIGLYYMDYLNWLDIAQLYVQPTYLWAAIAGGIIMGTGFLAGGYCPGTSLAGVAIGKIDAIVFTIGLMIGIFVFSEFYEVLEPLFNSTNLGNPTLADSFGIAPSAIILGFSVCAIIAFYVSDKVRAKVKKVIY